MAESCLDTWAFGASFARDNAALTRALQISLSDENFSESLPVIPTQPEPEAEPGPKPIRNQDRYSPAGRVGKRKTRVVRRATTTYITADPANFREMVQRMTGVQFGDPVLPVEPAGRSGLNRAGVQRQQQQWALPSTLDTSSALLGNRVQMGGPAAVEAGTEFDLEQVLSFPTLESWGVF
ncbi:hypothetical protein J5N97_013029 [Dioscorea zingiberensis]|uniref:VQ domain-containing protein n=1 Tax=Dioscorea zingiberensis TaxID=325984 RepID=A0A9D5CQ12_9LILI|nr:hypothetical protein J5N97_013029 [Dioscorea zingiberensis]